MHARINIEKELFFDTRFFDLAVKLGSQEAAIGSLVMAWIAAQEYWCPEKKPIPLSQWEKKKLKKEIIEVGLACIQDNGVYLSGSEKHFEWWFSYYLRGKKGGLTKAKNNSSNFSSKSLAMPSSATEKASSATEKASSAYPLTLSLTHKEYNTYALNDEKSPNKNAAVRASPHCKFDFELIYKQYPRKRGKKQGLSRCRAQIKTLDRFTLLEKAVNRFNEYHATQKTEAQFIPYFSTFMQSWEDWLDEDVGETVKLITVGEKREDFENQRMMENALNAKT